MSEPVRGWLRDLGIKQPGPVLHNHSTPMLIEEALQRNEGRLSQGGAFVTTTGKFTGRAANDKFTVRDDETEETVDWTANKAITPEGFDKLFNRVVAHLDGKELFVQDVWCGASKSDRLACRIVTREARHSHFVRNMFIVPTDAERGSFRPEVTVIHAPDFKADPARDGTNSEAFVLLNFKRKMVVIGGTEYAGEIKKSVFTTMNYFANAKGILTMHCSANIGKKGDAALFFGLSGTGKTTLSADPERGLIGDDEHGWGDEGVFNLEGGCYAKVIRLSPEAEPEIYATTRMFATLLENVVMNDETRELDLNDDRFTENTRASYPLSSIPNFVASGRGGHPLTIVFLTCDAYGVLPPIARLTPEQAMYHFLSGYTAKVAGTEQGVTEPKAAFSTCFGAPFMPRHPSDYARLLGKKMETHGAKAWLVNTGWTGGPYGEGKRMSIKHTRTLLNAALDGSLAHVEYSTHPIFNVAVPKAVPGVPSEVLDPKQTWKDQARYNEKAKYLAGLFKANFEKFAAQVSAAVRDAGPIV